MLSSNISFAQYINDQELLRFVMDSQTAGEEFVRPRPHSLSWDKRATGLYAIALT